MDKPGTSWGWWKHFWISLVCALLLVLVFTFLGGIEIEGVEYYPITWYPLRYTECCLHVYTSLGLWASEKFCSLGQFFLKN